MAEAIIVMTILGIIATILITNLKPSEFRDKGLEILAKKIINQIDQATEQILINNSYDGTTKHLYQPNSSNMYEFGTNYTYTLELYKKYLVTTRKPYNATTAPEIIKSVATKSSSANASAPPLYLKDGGIIFLGIGQGEGVSLSASSNVTLNDCEMSKKLAGIITIDINGEEEPNIMYKDQFHIPIGLKGVDYEQFCREMPAANSASSNDGGLVDDDENGLSWG